MLAVISMNQNTIYKRINQTLERKTDVLYMDLDFKNIKHIRSLAQAYDNDNNIVDYEIMETKKGYHFKIYFKDKIKGYEALKMLSIAGADTMFTYMWLTRGYQTLFNHRRGKDNYKEVDL